MKKTFSQSLHEIVDAVIISTVVVLIAFTFVFRIFVVFGTSMDKTLAGGQRIVVSDIFYTPERGDIVCLYSKAEEQVLVKRVIATEGQTVNIDHNGNVYVDNVKLSEEYIGDQMTQAHDVPMPHTVAKGCVFVMGDNRGVSLDSRYSLIGDIPCDMLYGKMLFRLNPFGKVE